jgi:hypothetical protein
MTTRLCDCSKCGIPKQIPVRTWTRHAKYRLTKETQEFFATLSNEQPHSRRSRSVHQPLRQGVRQQSEELEDHDMGPGPALAQENEPELEQENELGLRLAVDEEDDFEQMVIAACSVWSFKILISVSCSTLIQTS